MSVRHVSMVAFMELNNLGWVLILLNAHYEMISLSSQVFYNNQFVFLLTDIIKM